MFPAECANLWSLTVAVSPFLVEALFLRCLRQLCLRTHRTPRLATAGLYQSLCRDDAASRLLYPLLSMLLYLLCILA